MADEMAQEGSSSSSSSDLRQALEQYTLSKSATFDLAEESDSEADTFGSPSRGHFAQEEDVLMSGPADEQQGSDDIRCVCDNVDDDGFTIQCEDCLAWQHAVCVGIGKENVPESYFCELCRPDLHQKDGYWIPSAYGGGGNRRRKGTITISSQPINPSRLNLQEINENMLSKECNPGFAFLSTSFYPVLLPRMPGPPAGSSWSGVNFEFHPGMLAFPSGDELRSAWKAVEIREIRGRGAMKKYSSANNGSVTGQSTGGNSVSWMSLKLGVFAQQDIDPGVLILEYLGQVQVPSLLPNTNAGPKKTVVLQSHIMFIPKLVPTICVDARKYGNAARHIRRSCRPNCDVKLVLTGANGASDVHVCVFARNTILEGEELLLSIDYEDGNDLFRYECACGNAELCLAPEASVPAPKVRHSSAPNFEMVDTLQSLQQRRSRTPNQPATSGPLTGTASLAQQQQKLSREERKLQQYMEQIAKMESAERKSASRKSSSGMASSVSGIITKDGDEDDGESSTAASSPKAAASSSPARRPSASPRKKQLLQPKKKLVESEEDSTESERDEDEEDLAKGIDKVVSSPKKQAAAPSVKKKPGPKPKKQSPPKRMVQSDEESGASDNEHEAQISRLRERLFNEEEQLLDVGRPETFVRSTLTMAEIDRADSVSPFSSMSSGQPSGPPDANADAGSTSQLETPSKKRVSLSDYMKKRRATGDYTAADASIREEGEIPSRPAVQIAQPLKPYYNPTPSSSSRYASHSHSIGGQPYAGEMMPPHLTPPPPLQASRERDAMDVDYGAGSSIVRSESTSSSAATGGGYYDRPSAGSDHRYGHGASRYGYGKGKGAPPPSAVPPPSYRSHHYDYDPVNQPAQPQQPVYRPRPSLLKAAQDLPTRWEEASSSSRPKYPSTAPYDYSSTSSAALPPASRRDYDDPSYPSGSASRRSFPSSSSAYPFPDRYYDEYGNSSGRDYSSLHPHPHPRPDNRGPDPRDGRLDPRDGRVGPDYPEYKAWERRPSGQQPPPPQRRPN